MNDLILQMEDIAIRALTPAQQFWADITTVVTQVLWTIKHTIISDTIMRDPLLLFPIGVIALGGVVGIVGRLLSRD